MLSSTVRSRRRPIPNTFASTSKTQWRVSAAPSSWGLQGFGRYTHGRQWWRPAERAVLLGGRGRPSREARRASGKQSRLTSQVYGEGYKNSFVAGGEEITWFAQPRQWEGTPVVQRLINADGGEAVDEESGETQTFDETPVLLFCREEGQGYVYCGELAYLGHDPTRIPIRFVWQLTDYEQLKDAPPFQSLVANCRNLLASPRPLG